MSAPVDMPTCADLCRHVPTCANMWSHSQHLWYQPFETYLECWHVSAHLDMPTCACMCRHVPTCDINHDTSDSDHLDLIWMLACVSICGHVGVCWYVPICTGMCEHVKPLSAPLIPTIWNLSCMLACVSKLGHANVCWYVPACADMFRHVPTCDINHDTSYSDHLDLI